MLSALNLRPREGTLGAFIDMLHTGGRPLPFEETVELMAVIIAGIRSRELGGSVIAVADILSELNTDQI